MASNIKSDSATFEKKSYSGVFMPKGTIMDKKWNFLSFMRNWFVGIFLIFCMKLQEHVENA